MTKMGKKEQMVFMMRFGEKKTRRRNSLGKLRGGDITWNHWAPGWEGRRWKWKGGGKGGIVEKDKLGVEAKGFHEKRIPGKHVKDEQRALPIGHCEVYSLSKWAPWPWSSLLVASIVICCCWQNVTRPCLGADTGQLNQPFLFLCKRALFCARNTDQGMAMVIMAFSTLVNAIPATK